MLLAGDIGGTKTHLAIISPEVGPHAPLAEATFPSARYRQPGSLRAQVPGQVDMRRGSGELRRRRTGGRRPGDRHQPALGD